MQQIAEGKYTDTVYTWIQQEQWHDAISLLSYQLQLSPRSRAGLSLLAYCQFQIEKYEEAAPLYETLAQLFPEKQSYRYSHALCLYRLGDLETCKDVLRGLSGMEKEKAQLLANIALLLDDRAQVKTKLQAMEEDETEARVTKGCLLFAEGKYVEAKELFDATFKGTFLPQQAYNSALCAFRLKRYGEALKLIALVIENGIRNYPDLGVGSYLDDGDVRPVGNSVALRESALIESLNLKAAIEYTMKNVDQAQEVLKDLPPRAEEDVDAITLHNQALIYFNQDPTSGLKKLNHLLLNPPHPPETFLNLLLLYCKPGIGRFNLVADMMAENPEMVSTHLSRDKEGLLRALITQQDSPSSAYGAWERLAEDYVQRLRIVTKRIQSCRTNNDDAGVKKAVQDYDEILELYMPVVMGMAQIHWDVENWAAVEKVFKQSAEFCSDQDDWQLNVAHVLFREERWEEAIRYYLPLVRNVTNNSDESILKVPAIVLANLCVAYIMTNKNADAEDLMKHIERDEDRMAFQDKQFYHLCIVNLAIGTLYCAKGNFEFGILRITKALEPMERRLSADTWHYAKRCFVAMADNLAKHMIVVKDATMGEILAFLEDAEKAGRGKYTTFDESAVEDRRTISSEARRLRQVFLRLRNEDTV